MDAAPDLKRSLLDRRRELESLKSKHAAELNAAGAAVWHARMDLYARIICDRIGGDPDRTARLFKTLPDFIDEAEKLARVIDEEGRRDPDWDDFPVSGFDKLEHPGLESEPREAAA